jgi:hypothetical protein
MRYQIKVSPFWRPFFTVFGSPKSSAYVDVDLERRVMRVRCGIWFDEELRIDEIEGASSSTWPWWGGLGVKLGPGSDTVSVVCSLDGVIEVRFKTPQRMRVLFNVRRSKLRLSLEEPEALMSAIRDALARAEGARDVAR